MARLERWGRWLKQRRPRVAIERIDAQLITRLPRELLELSGQGDGVRHAEHDARVWRLSRAPGSVDDAARCDG